MVRRVLTGILRPETKRRVEPVFQYERSGTGSRSGCSLAAGRTAPEVLAFFVEHLAEKESYLIL